MSAARRKEYDYIIIGGGTAGLTIAKRLAEDPNVSVVVIEAGGHYQRSAPLLASLPIGDATFVGTKEYLPTVDWGFAAPKDPASGNQKRYYARGKCLGGTSARNFMIYQRPTVQTLEKWADEVGDSSYTFDKFLPFFKRSVHFTPPSEARTSGTPTLYNENAFSDTGGPLNVSYPNYAQPFSGYMEAALNEINIPTIQDFNSGRLLGCQYCTTTINPKTQYRESSQTAFLRSAIVEGMKNLKVIDHTMTRKIIFDDHKRAIGVLVKGSFGSRILKVKKEVIVCAGAFQSPQILMCSGVGPAAELLKFDIPLVVDVPGVGQNLQDHIFFGPSYRVKVTTLSRLANNPFALVGRYAQHRTKKNGPCTSNIADFLGWEKIPPYLRPTLGEEALKELARFPIDWPEVEYLSGAGFIGDWSSLFLKQPRDGYEYATILAALVAPLSRGTVTLQSASTSTLPLINPAYLYSPTDQKVAVAAYKRVREAFHTKAMQEIVIGEEYYPGVDVQTDEEILETIKGSLQTVWHASCTCKMGRESDPMAVVDTEARVRGVSGVRVVDASAFPFLPPGHPQSSVYALAEKIADDIKREKVMATEHKV